MKKRPFVERIGDFMAGKGFYIVLFLCVAAIGISGYYLFSSLGGKDPAAPVGGTAQVTVTPSPSVSPSPPVDAVKPTIPAPPSPTPTPADPLPLPVGHAPAGEAIGLPPGFAQPGHGCPRNHAAVRQPGSFDQPRPGPDACGPNGLYLAGEGGSHCGLFPGGAGL